MATILQHELTDGLYFFIFDTSTARLPDHAEAPYFVPGGGTYPRWRLVRLFPKLRDTKRELPGDATNGKPGARVDLEGRARAIQMHESGVPVLQIAERLDRTAKTIRTWLKSA